MSWLYDSTMLYNMQLRLAWQVSIPKQNTWPFRDVSSPRCPAGGEGRDDT